MYHPEQYTVVPCTIACAVYNLVFSWRGCESGGYTIWSDCPGSCE